MSDPKIHTYADGSISYWDLGTGPCILMVHGFCEDKSMFEPFLELSKKNRLIIPDLPGFGGSSIPLGKGQMKTYAQALHSLIQALDLKDIHFIGHSMGAYAGLELLDSYKPSFKTFSIFHSHPFADSVAIRKKRQKSIDFIHKHGTSAFFKPFFANLFPSSKQSLFTEKIEALAEASKDISAAAIIYAQEAMADRRDHSKTLEQFGGITQYIVGQLDEIAPADLGLQQILLSKVGLFHLIEDCGHMGQWEKPAIILKHFQELLKISETLKR